MWGQDKSVVTQHMQLWQAMCTLCLASQDEETFNQGKRKLREEEGRTIMLYYELRDLVEFLFTLVIAEETSISPNSSHRPSRLIVFY